jgi:hypothetical protein
MTGSVGWRRVIIATAVGMLAFGTVPNAHAETNSASFVSQDVPATVRPGATFRVRLTVRNEGTTTWRGVHDAFPHYVLGSADPMDNTTWGGNRVDLTIGAEVPPGSVYPFEFDVAAPSMPGHYVFRWRMLQETIEWFGQPSARIMIAVEEGPQIDDAQIESSSVPSSLSAGQRTIAFFTFRNTGTTTWTNDASSWQDYRLRSESPTDNMQWGFNRVDMPLGTSVLPGQTFTFGVPIDAPLVPGAYVFQVRLIKEGVAPFGDFSAPVQITVREALVTNCLEASPFDDLPDTAAIQACLDSLQVVELSPGRPGYVIDGAGLKMRYAGRTLTSSQPPSKVTLRAAPDLPRWNRLLLTGPDGPDRVDDITIAYVIFDGRSGAGRQYDSFECGRLAEDAWLGSGGNIVLKGARLRFEHNESVRAVCGSGLEVELWPGSTVAHNYIALNGRGWDELRASYSDLASRFPWADGMTVWGCAGSRISDNTFVDNTDIDLVFGATRYCDVTRNVIRHETRYAFAGLMIENDFFNDQGLPPGDHSGSHFTDNWITSSRTNGMGIGLLVGARPWFPERPVYDAGTVTGNTVSGAKINLVVDTIRAGTITGNTMASPRAGTIPFFDCTLSANYVVGRYEEVRSWPVTLQPEWLNYNIAGGQCEANPFVNTP